MKMLIMNSTCKQLISVRTEFVVAVCNFESEFLSCIRPTLCSEVTAVLNVHPQDPPGIWGYLPQVGNPPGCEPWPWDRSWRQHGCQFDNGRPGWCTSHPPQSQSLQKSAIGMSYFKSGIMHYLHKVHWKKPRS
jgi:hypothetical protein